MSLIAVFVPFVDRSWSVINAISPSEKAQASAKDVEIQSKRAI